MALPDHILKKPVSRSFKIWSGSAIPSAFLGLAFTSFGCRDPKTASSRRSIRLRICFVDLSFSVVISSSCYPRLHSRNPKSFCPTAQYLSRTVDSHFCENMPLSRQCIPGAPGDIVGGCLLLTVPSRIGVLPNLLVSRAHPLTPQFSSTHQCLHHPAQGGKRIVPSS